MQSSKTVFEAVRRYKINKGEQALGVISFCEIKNNGQQKLVRKNN